MGRDRKSRTNADFSILVRPGGSRQVLEHQTTNLGVRSSNLFGRATSVQNWARQPFLRLKRRRGCAGSGGGYGLIIDRNPSPGSHLAMRSDLSLWER
jgi:hypothetical protein